MISAMEILLHTAEEKGNEIALRDETHFVLYRELLVLAYQISDDISKWLQGKNNLILVVTNKTVISVVAFWGIIASGNCYIAIDDKTPINRFNNIISKINPSLVIYADGKQIDKLETDIHSIVLDAYLRKITDHSLDAMDSSKKRESNLSIIGQDPLYLVFTSGSTGTPKAIVKSHQSILQFVEAFVKEFDLSKDKGQHQVFGNQASFDFDVSAKDIFISAYIGATLCLIPNKCFLLPAKLEPFLEDYGITILIWAAAAVKYVKQFDCFKKSVPSKLRKVFFSGESMSGESINYWREKKRDVEFVNLYAPSEVTGNCLYHIVTDEQYEDILPLDRTIPNSEVLLIGENGTPIHDGEKGEIYVRGSFLAQGYYNDSEQTNLRFVQNPLNSQYRDIVYKTGDWVLKKGDRLYFCGRQDNQIKHMGHRIELEEIETNIVKAIHCENICVVYDTERENIVVLTNDTTLEFDHLVKTMKPFIPKYMIPHKIVYIEKIPQNSRGKIDRKQAAKLYEELMRCEKKS